MISGLRPVRLFWIPPRTAEQPIESEEAAAVEVGGLWPILGQSERIRRGALRGCRAEQPNGFRIPETHRRVRLRHGQEDAWAERSDQGKIGSG